MHKPYSVNVFQIVPLVLATLFVTLGVAMYLGGTVNIADALRSVIVVFGGAVAGVLLSFPLVQITDAFYLALSRGIQGGNSPREMIRAMLKVCDISRREGLLGVADIRSNSVDLENICQLIGDASDDTAIRFALDRRIASEHITHKMATDVFTFAAIYACVFGVLASLLRFVNAPVDSVSGNTFLPFVCGLSFSIILLIMVGRLRAAHMREIVIAEIAYRGASIILEDNNVQRLQSRLASLVPAGLRL